MKKLYFAIVILLISTATLLSAEFAGGTGTEADPYLVETAAHLNNVRLYPEAWFLQIDHIDLTGYANWEPIGGNGTLIKFTGHYYGAGKTISNLTIDRPDKPNVGLFGHIGMDGSGATTISNVKLVTVNVTGARGTGSLVGRVTGNQNTRIEHCSVSAGSVKGDGATGGLVGSNNSYRLNGANAESFRPVIYNCWSHVDVSLRSADSPGKDKFGGLAGCNQKGLISNSYARGNVTASNAQRVGGLAGCVEYRGIIINSFATGTISAEGSTLTGGLLGYGGIGGQLGTATDCYFINTQPPGSGGTALTEAQLKDENNFPNWDFINIWDIHVDQNDNYPFLRETLPDHTQWKWLGHFDSSWTNPDNWNQSTAPSNGSNILIPQSSELTGNKIWPEVLANITLQKVVLENEARINIEGNEILLSITGSLIYGSEVGSAEITGDGSIVMAGHDMQEIPSMIFSNLTINNLNNVRLSGNILVKGTLKMQQGLLDLNGFDIDLGETGMLDEREGENFTSRVFGLYGVIKLTRNFNNPLGEIAGLGLEITTSSNLGLTTIQRGHSELVGSSDSKSILRWFDISPANNSELEATLVFHYSKGDLNFNDQVNGFSLFKKGAEDTEWIHVPSTLNASEQFITAGNVQSFSTWTVANSSTPMPIVLLSFDGKAVEDAVELSWITAAELNNDYFTIERSRDGVNFTGIGTQLGAGTTSQMQHYSFTDKDPITGIAYYRLRQTDFNAGFEYSKIISVYSQTVLEEEIQLFPNPNNGQFKVIINGEKAMDLRIYNMLGKMVYSTNAVPGHVTSVDISGLQKGIYTVIFYGDEITARKIQVY